MLSPVTRYISASFVNKGAKSFDVGGLDCTILLRKQLEHAKHQAEANKRRTICSHQYITAHYFQNSKEHWL